MPSCMRAPHEAGLGIERHVEEAGVTDVEIGLELAVKQHLAAARALVPQIVRDLFLGDDGADLGEDKVGEPAHRAALVPPRAARTPAARAATSASTASTSLA